MLSGMFKSMLLVALTMVLAASEFIAITNENIFFVMLFYSAIIGAVYGAISNAVTDYAMRKLAE